MLRMLEVEVHLLVMKIREQTLHYQEKVAIRGLVLEEAVEQVLRKMVEMVMGVTVVLDV